MNSFIDNLISRHSHTYPTVQPRIRGKFEPVGLSSSVIPTEDFEAPAMHPEYNSAATTAGEKIRNAGSHNIRSVEPQASNKMEAKNQMNSPWLFSSSLNDRLQEKNYQNEEYSGERETHANAPNFAKPSGNNNHPVIKGVQDTGTLTGMDQQNKNAVAFSKEISYTPALIQPVSKKSLFEKFKTPGNTKSFKGILGEPPGLHNYNSKLNSGSIEMNVNREMMPVIKVTIGRIDVRAITKPALPVTAKTTSKPRMSLDDYLNKRNKGEQ
ncbi:MULTISPECIES: hypothetical protein [Niastella]|uniref:Uncharacterized protein n=1 Tax=Niastella soli TaxID=2821487 RepID=A0ABS3Z5P1_9BACT|nr:hypothetical protein [Niastella soli]MBO9205493.1 hypothetical protein [Niastella soli]